MFKFQTLGNMNRSPLDKSRPVHLIGGGGVGMSGLGHLLLNLGYQVTASDKNPGPYLEKLSAAGAKTWVGSLPENINPDSVVYYSTAIRAEDPERRYCSENNIPAFPRHGLLSDITEKYYTIGISGTHGKTTTTGWVTWLFECAGLDPNALVGGTITRWGSNFRKGDGKIQDLPLLVIEADESDESFLHIRAREIIITNIELDHVDNYQGIGHVEEKFSGFVENCDRLDGVFFPSLELPVERFESSSSYRRAKDILSRISSDESRHSLLYESNGQVEVFRIGLNGVHNLWNASAVLAMGVFHGLPFEIIRRALSEYTGVERRMQILATFRNKKNAPVDIMDDYAHHPTEIRAVLKTLNEKGEDIIAVWEPHRVSRFLHFNNEFMEAFLSNLPLNRLFLMDIYDAAGEKSQGEYASWEKTWEGWINMTQGLVSSSGGHFQLMRLLEAQSIKTTLVFLGAGNSSAFARSFAASIKP